MLDHAGSPPDLSLFVAGGDDIYFVGPSGQWLARQGGPDLCGRASQPRRLDHVYRVVQEGPGSGRLAVFIEKVIEGDQKTAASGWARASFATSPSGIHDGFGGGESGCRAAQAQSLGA
jgi:hypothetical protein